MNVIYGVVVNIYDYFSLVCADQPKPFDMFVKEYCDISVREEVNSPNFSPYWLNYHPERISRVVCQIDDDRVAIGVKAVIENLRIDNHATGRAYEELLERVTPPLSRLFTSQPDILHIPFWN